MIFEKMRSFFAEKSEAGGGTMNFVPLIESRRSAPEILAAVDLVFADPARAEGLIAAGTPVHHIAHRLKDAGYVELWEPEAVETPDTDWQIWEVPDAAPDETARRKLARRIAAKISSLIHAPDSLLTPGDILILVRRRDAFNGREGLAAQRGVRRVQAAVHATLACPCNKLVVRNVARFGTTVDDEDIDGLPRL